MLACLTVSRAVPAVLAIEPLILPAATVIDRQSRTLVRAIDHTVTQILDIVNAGNAAVWCYVCQFVPLDTLITVV
jgi:hypothetical protein